MLDLLRVRRVAHGERAKLQARLRAAPWIWPRDESAGGVRFAEDHAGIARPRPEPGRTILVTSHDAGASVWLLGGADLDTMAFGERAEMAPSARQAWDASVVALSRCLPVLWKLEPRLEEPPVVIRLGTRAASDSIANDPLVLRGPSFGVSFLLALVSRLFDRPLPLHVAASAELSALGEVVPVGGLSQKIDALMHVTPQITHLLVAAPQIGEAIEASAGRLSIVPVDSGEHAIRRVFEDRLVSLLLDARGEPAQVRDRARDFFALAIAGRGDVHDWAPVERAARLALDAFGAQLEPFDRYDIELAGAIAARHRDNAGALEPPPAAWLDRHPAPLRLGLVATLVQHTADTGVFAVDAMEARARSLLVPLSEAHAPHLKLAGALGRLLAVTGRPREALTLQQDAARAFQAIRQPGDASHPLAEWFRLAGVCDEPALFDEADRFYAELRRSSPFDFYSTTYVDLARARTLVLLGRLDAYARHAATVFDRLAADGRVHDGVRWSAVRWRIRVLDDRLDTASADRLMSELEQTAARSIVPQVARAMALAKLDRAVRQGSADDRRACLDALALLQPGVVGHLRAAAPGMIEAPSYVARFFPY